MRWSDFASFNDFVACIERLERLYTDKIFHRLYSNAGNLQAWYNEANKVRETWLGKISTAPKDQSVIWTQVGEIVVVGLIIRSFPEWFPVGLPIGSETRLSSADAVIHIDVKSHKEGDPDLDHTQDVRPEQISGDGDYKQKFPDNLPAENSWVEDLQGRLGDTPPKLPPYYDFGENVVKVCLTFFIICVYEFDADQGYQYLKRVQLVTVPNGILRHVRDYRNIFRAGKDGRQAHRFRIALPALAAHENWRWREFRYEPYSVVVTR